MSSSEIRMPKYTEEQKKTFNLIMAATGCIALGAQFGWLIGLATFCLLPFVLKSIKGNAK